MNRYAVHDNEQKGMEMGILKNSWFLAWAIFIWAIYNGAQTLGFEIYIKNNYPQLLGFLIFLLIGQSIMFWLSGDKYSENSLNKSMMKQYGIIKNSNGFLYRGKDYQKLEDALSAARYNKIQEED